MKKVLVIGLVTCVLANSLPKGYLHAFFKIPNLLEHFHHHQAETQDYSFIHFLVDHYFGTHQDDDQNHHEDLPLHDSDTTISFQLMPCLLPAPTAQVIFTTERPIFFTKKEKSIHQNSDISISYSHDIWQPPRA